MNQRLLIAVLSTISMLLAGGAILLNNNLLSVIAFGGFTIAATLNWVSLFSKETRAADTERRRRQYEELKQEFATRDR